MDLKKLTKEERNLLLHILIHLTKTGELKWDRSKSLSVSYSAYLKDDKEPGVLSISISVDMYLEQGMIPGNLRLDQTNFTHTQFDWELYKNLLGEILTQIDIRRKKEAIQANNIVQNLFNSFSELPFPLGKGSPF